MTPVKLAVPDMISPSYFPAIAAAELGFFREEGIDVEVELIFPVDKAYMALRDGAVDFVGGSAHSALAAFPQRGEGAGGRQDRRLLGERHGRRGRGTTRHRHRGARRAPRRWP
jgi:hypothetical protein